MLRVAIVGSGFMGKSHAEAYKALPGVELAGIINPNPKNAVPLARETGCGYFASLEDAVKEGPLDIVSVCTPTYLHEQYVIEAAQAGCHVLCEKPVTFTLESFDRMVKACQDNGVKLMVAQVARWWPEFIDIARRLNGGELGRIHMIYEKRLCQLPTWSTWHRDPAKSGGGLYDLNIHDIDFLVSVYGRPESVFATGHKGDGGAWMYVVTSLLWPNGVKATVETCIEMPGPWPFSIEFRGAGDRGTLHYNLQAGMNIKDGEQNSNYTWYPAGAQAPETLPVAQTDMFVSEITEFVDAVKNNGELPVPLAESRVVLEVVLATLRSLEEGGIQKV
ncbi:MAG: Gfo/Idh/MocA family oxidoreductase [Eubacteriales bacterium]|nr:Gfo/Idh/MocA family oxidoreductase [Eubacteriales bacterium]MDD3571804.1 Gfo/Idh/MocA family oxidoreductase [Eubacteriales bacterium]MDD4133715.1 Gfo/Idh/MocA family oxidoreductase [Eubacteriales bacterium]NLO13962.1 Gfo/Idh/MocA family oxidoreductase [Clostridiales bacterium]